MKIIKNITAVLLAVLLIASCLCVAGVSASAASGNKVYLKNSAGWSNPSCYMWTGSGNPQNGAWPGQAMTNVSDDVWSYTLYADYENIIFNGNGGSAQTDAMPFPGGDKIYDNSTGQWSDINSLFLTNSVTNPIIQTDPVTDPIINTDPQTNPGGDVTTGLKVTTALNGATINTIDCTGTSVTVTYNLQAPLLLEDGQGTLKYDASKLQIQSFTLPNIQSGLISNKNVAGEAYFNFTGVNAETNSGIFNFKTNKPLVIATFNVVGSGATTINFDMEELDARENGQQITYYTNKVAAPEASTITQSLSNPTVDVQGDDYTTQPTDNSETAYSRHRIRITDVVNSDPEIPVETHSYMFYVPDEWKNTYNNYYNLSPNHFAAGIYWWEGPYNCNDYRGDFKDEWPGYAVTETVDGQPNIYVAEVPVDAGKIIWNNLVDGGTDKEKPIYTAAIQSMDIQHEYYDPNEDSYGFYPDGVASFDGMIYVCDPNATEENPLTNKLTYKGAWFYYYGDGEYGIYTTREEALLNNGVFKNGEFPHERLSIDKNELNLNIGEMDVIKPNQSLSSISIANPDIVSALISDNGSVYVNALKAGTTTITFYNQRDTVTCRVIVEDYTESDDSIDEQPTSLFGKTQLFSFLPSKKQLEKGDTIKLVVKDKYGHFTITEMTPTPEYYDGVPVYTAKLPADIIPATVQFQIFKGETWVEQVSLTSEQYKKVKDKIITSNGTAYGERKPNPPKTSAKKTNPINVTVKTKTVKLKKLKKKAQKVKAITVKKAQGKVTYKLVKKGSTAKIFKLAKINSKGVITLKKWKKAKKGTYKIKVTITAAGNSNYNKKTVNKVVKIKIR